MRTKTSLVLVAWLQAQLGATFVVGWVAWIMSAWKKINTDAEIDDVFQEFGGQ